MHVYMMLPSIHPQLLLLQMQVRFKITTVTSNVFGAGTDAPVFITIQGPTGMLGLGEIALSNSKNNFERNQTDEFFVEVPSAQDCGTPINAIMMERGSSMTLGADWHLDTVSVMDINRGHSYSWKCGQWFDSKHGLKKTWSSSGGANQGLNLIEGPPGIGPEKSVAAGAIPSTQPVAAGTDATADEPTAGAGQAGGEPYQLLFVTSDRFGAGTNAKVRVQFEDEAGTPWQPEFTQTPDQFERGCRNELYVMSQVALKQLVKACVWQEGGGLGAAWHLDHIIVTHMPSGGQWRFKCAAWVPRGKGPKDGVVLQAEKLGAAAAAAAGVVQASAELGRVSTPSNMAGLPPLMHSEEVDVNKQPGRDNLWAVAAYIRCPAHCSLGRMFFMRDRAMIGLDCESGPL